MAKRLFVALELPDRTKHELARLGAKLAPEAPKSARFVRESALHVTMKFLGAVEEERVDAIAREVEAAAQDHAPIALTPVRLTGFGSERRAHVLVVELSSEADLASALAADLERRLEPLGFSREQRPFRAHVTLARIKHPSPIRELCKKPLAFAPFVAEHLTLFESRSRGSEGAEYVAIKRGLLAPR